MLPDAKTSFPTYVVLRYMYKYGTSFYKYYISQSNTTDTLQVNTIIKVKAKVYTDFKNPFIH
jgi:hypothetical protein